MTSGTHPRPHLADYQSTIVLLLQDSAHIGCAYTFERWTGNHEEHVYSIWLDFDELGKTKTN